MGKERLMLQGVIAAWIGVHLLLAQPAMGHAAELSCLIQPYVVITITSPVGGLLENVAVDRGDLIKEGQTLASSIPASSERPVPWPMRRPN